MSFTFVRLACFRLGIIPPITSMKGLHTSPARPKDEPHPRPEHCPGISGIAVPYLLKSLSGNYRNPCPGICETRKFLRISSNVSGVRSSGFHHFGHFPRPTQFAQRMLLRQCVT